MNHWMFHCKDVSQKVSQAMDTRLPLYERMAIEIHMRMCRYCARFRSQLRLMVDAVGRRGAAAIPIGNFVQLDVQGSADSGY